MKKVLVFFVCLLLAQVRVMAQDIQVQPSPRQVNVTGKSMTIPVAFRLVGEQEANPHAIALLKQFLGDRLGTEGFPLFVGEKGDRAVRGAKRLIPDHPEGYYLSITDKGNVLCRAYFHAVVPRGAFTVCWDSGLPGRTFPGRGRGILRYALEPRGPFEATAFLRGEQIKHVYLRAKRRSFP